jgi:serine/threonine protein kinase
MHISFQEFQKRYRVNFKAKKDDPDFLGRGGYGTVYKGKDLRRHTEVAIKRAETDRGLLDEVERAKSVPIHPNIANYVDGFRVETEADEFDVAILQYYKEGNLDTLITEAYPSEIQLDEIFRGILEGLQFLHNGFLLEGNKHVKIIHRDLKPQNILIVKDEAHYIPIITDFGISKVVRWEDVHSTGGVDMTTEAGTLVYKAPEQVKGLVVRNNLDLWAFGVMLFKIITGKLPFSSQQPPSTEAFRVEVMQQITESDLQLIFDQLVQQPLRYQQMVRACLVRDIKKRIQSADELIDILDEIPILLTKAQTFVEAKEYDPAIEQFEKILEKRPQHTHALAGIEQCQQQVEEATIAQLLKQAETAFNAQLWQNTIEKCKDICLRQPQHIRAKELLKLSERELSQEGQIIALANEATALYTEKKYEQAKVIWKQLLKLKPNEKSYQTQIIACEESISLQTIETLWEVSATLFQQQDYEKAIVKYQEILKIAPQHSQAIAQISSCKEAQTQQKIAQQLKDATTLFTQKKYKNAQKIFKQILEQDPANQQAQRGIAQCVEDLTPVLTESITNKTDKYETTNTDKTDINPRPQPVPLPKPAEKTWQAISLPYFVAIVVLGGGYGLWKYTAQMPKVNDVPTTIVADTLSVATADTTSVQTKPIAQSKTLTDNNTAPLLAKAQRAAQQKDWKTAIRYCDEVLANHPHQTEAKQIKAKSKKALEEQTIAETQKLAQEQAQNEYNNLIDSGLDAISKNNKAQAIGLFSKASQLANDNGLATTKANGAYSLAIEKGNRYFGLEEYKGAKDWYKVAEAVKNTSEVQQKIKDCNANL